MTPENNALDEMSVFLVEIPRAEEGEEKSPFYQVQSFYGGKKGAAKRLLACIVGHAQDLIDREGGELIWIKEEA